MFGERKAPLEDLLEGLFHVAAADGDRYAATSRAAKRARRDW